MAVEWATDINVLRLHDLKHGADYVATPAPSHPVPRRLATSLPMAGHRYEQLPDQQGAGAEPACGLPGLPLHAGARPCAVRPLGRRARHLGNGRNQVAHQSNSRVMHNHHGSLTDDTGTPLLDNDGGPLFPSIDPPIQTANGCHRQPGCPPRADGEFLLPVPSWNPVQCLRGAMFNGGMLCSDCHGDMEAVGADFTAGVSPTQPRRLPAGSRQLLRHASVQPRVPWANEPGCGSCHTGDATNNVLTNNNDGITPADVIVNIKDNSNNIDGIRLRQAFRIGDSKATPIVPANTRFAENSIPQDFNGFANPGFATIPDSDGAENPKLYRVSTGHGGVMCEGCHGATHAEWPNGNPNANDNVAANQLQGHTGTIIECSTCHVTSELASNTQGGPHGMHLVNDRRFWKEGHKDAAKQQNGDPAAAPAVPAMAGITWAPCCRAHRSTGAGMSKTSISSRCSRVSPSPATSVTA